MSPVSDPSLMPPHFLNFTCDLDRSLDQLFRVLRERMPLDGIRVGFLDNATFTTYWLRHHSPQGGPAVPCAVVHAGREIREVIGHSTWDQEGNWARIINNPQCLAMGKIFVDQMGSADWSLIHVRSTYDASKRGHFLFYAQGQNRYGQEHLDAVLEFESCIMLLLAGIIRDFLLQQLQVACSSSGPERLRVTEAYDLVAASPCMQEIMRRLERVSQLPTSVLITGETGVGKEVMADFIHMHSPRRNMPFVKLNCGAMPPNLLDSELFGYEKGAFTGANAQKAGCFERADTGTLMLDEAGEMPPDVQVRLLRVLQSGTYERVGGSRTLRADVRIIAATNRNLEEMVARGAFREDLFYRLNVYSIRIPPLRERPEDLPMLVRVLLRNTIKKLHIHVSPIVRQENIDALAAHPWKGNVRELQNAIEASLIDYTMTDGTGEFWISPPGCALPSAMVPGRPVSPARVQADGEAGGLSSLKTRFTLTEGGRFPLFDEAVCAVLTGALLRCKGKIYGRTGAAALLGLKPSTLWGKLNKYGIRPRDFEDAMALK